MNLLFAISFISTIGGITSNYLASNVRKYFESDVVNRSTEKWQKYQIAFENTLSIAMQETYGYKGMNLYVKRPPNPLFISAGYYHNDNQVHICIQGMTLEDYPQISDPLIQFPLTYNMINLEALVSRMIIHADYVLFRNTSNIAYDLREQNNNVMSPFLFEQVKNVGQLAITVEGCKIYGIAITSLAGRSVNLGNDGFRLRNCYYNFEIFSNGVSSPPVIANYLPASEGLSIESLLMRPLQAELRPKLEAALQSYINTSSIFQGFLPTVIRVQERVFEQSTNYLNNVVKNLNVLTMTRNMGKIVINDFSIRWNDTFDEEPEDSVVTLSNMILTGLETAYSSHTGGPFKSDSIEVFEELRFGTLQVRGSIDVMGGDKTKGMHDFAIEISDVEVDVMTDVTSDDDVKQDATKPSYTVEVIGWRSAQFSCPGMLYVTSEALITGFLLTKVPIYLTKYLNSVLSDAILETNKEYENLADNKLKLAGAEVDDNENRPLDENYPNANLEQETNDAGSDYIVEGDNGGNTDTITGDNIDNGDESEEHDDSLEADRDGIVTPSAIIKDIDENMEENPPAEPGHVASGESLSENEKDLEPHEQQGQLELVTKFFDENMFNMAQNQGKNSESSWKA